MKSTGIVRRIDELGRIVLPMELRRTFEIDIKDAIEIYTENDSIIFKKYQTKCIICGNEEDLENIKGKAICPECIKRIRNM